MFSLQRYARKKENEKRTIEEKKKKLGAMDEEERNKVYPLKATDGQPKKRVNKN